MGPQYEFATVWRVPGTVDEVTDVLGDATGLPRWWPAVYLAVDLVEAGGPDGVGRTLDLHTKGWLPYTLSPSPVPGSPWRPPATSRGRAAGRSSRTGPRW
jgi:hypothetical protein